MVLTAGLAGGVHANGLVETVECRGPIWGTVIYRDFPMHTVFLLACPKTVDGEGKWLRCGTTLWKYAKFKARAEAP